MADEVTTEETVTETVTPPQDTGETPKETRQTEDTPDITALQAENERLSAALKAANSESAGRRKKLEEYERQEQERQDAELSEVERLTKRNAELEAANEQATAQARETLIRSAFVAAAAQANATNPADAYALAMADGATIEVEDGRVSGVDEAVKALVDAGRLPTKRAAAPNLDGGAGSGQRPADVKANNLTDEELRIARGLGITPEQYQKGKTRQ